MLTSFSPKTDETDGMMDRPEENQTNSQWHTEAAAAMVAASEAVVLLAARLRANSVYPLFGNPSEIMIYFIYI